jgi:hypothetical protein
MHLHVLLDPFAFHIKNFHLLRNNHNNLENHLKVKLELHLHHQENQEQNLLDQVHNHKSKNLLFLHKEKFLDNQLLQHPLK